MKTMMTALALTTAIAACQPTKPRAFVSRDETSGSLTAIADGVLYQAQKKDSKTLMSSSGGVAEIACVDGEKCGTWVLNVYNRDRDDLAVRQFSSSTLTIPADLFEESGEQPEYVGPALSDEGLRALNFPLGAPTEDDDQRLGPWLDLRGGGIAEGPVHTVESKNPDGTVTKVFGKLVGASPLVPDRASLRRISSEQHTYGTGHMFSLLKNSSSAYAAAFDAQAFIAVGGIAEREGGFNPPHSSHQNGLDADIAYLGQKGFSSVIDRDGHVVPEKFDAQKNWSYWRMLYGQRILDRGKAKSVVSMILVGPRVKTYLCDWAKQTGLLADSENIEIMKRIRPTEGHDDHFHLRLHCSPYHALCVRENYAPKDTGCEAPGPTL